MINGLRQRIRAREKRCAGLRKWKRKYAGMATFSAGKWRRGG
jgi:hypothetical protein